jgi:L-alanine-DL-glutamate epimerase-like enolase superfamily enzyme
MRGVTVTKLRTQLVHLPLAEPVDGGAYMLRTNDCVLIFLESSAGLVGEGLIHVLNNRRLDVLHDVVKSLEQAMVGLDVGMAGSFSLRAKADLAFLGFSSAAAIGVAGVEMALWDLRAKAAGLSVATMLGVCRKTVPVYHSGGLWLSRSIDELQREAADFVRQGYRALKVRIGKFGIDVDVKRVRAVREAVGPEIALMVDANQQLGVPDAIRLGRALEEFHLAWFEEPVFRDNHTGEAAVAAALDTPVASGESIYASGAILNMLQQGAADILMPDLQRMGGPTEFVKAARIADAYNKPVSPHLFPEISLSLAASIPNATYIEYMPWFEPIYAERLQIDSKGKAVVPEAPGWGFRFDPAAIKKYAA